MIFFVNVILLVGRTNATYETILDEKNCYQKINLSLLKYLF